jgi:hypothetical protein
VILFPGGQTPQQSEAQFGGREIGETFGKPWRSESGCGETVESRKANQQKAKAHIHSQDCHVIVKSPIVVLWMQSVLVDEEGSSTGQSAG